MYLRGLSAAGNPMPLWNAVITALTLTTFGRMPTPHEYGLFGAALATGATIGQVHYMMTSQGYDMNGAGPPTTSTPDDGFMVTGGELNQAASQMGSNMNDILAAYGSTPVWLDAVFAGPAPVVAQATIQAQAAPLTTTTVIAAPTLPTTSVTPVASGATSPTVVTALPVNTPAPVAMQQIPSGNLIAANMAPAETALTQAMQTPVDYSTVDYTTGTIATPVAAPGSSNVVLLIAIALGIFLLTNKD